VVVEVALEFTELLDLRLPAPALVLVLEQQQEQELLGMESVRGKDTHGVQGSV
jgi:hypothetical protein